MADEIRAAGAVVCRSPGDGPGQVLLVHRPKYDDWGFAKGKLEPGEHVLLAAVREVREETGLQVALGRRLPAVTYLNGGTAKRVDYWAAAPEGGGAFDEFVPNREIDEVAWVTADERAGSLLTYRRDADTLAAFVAGPRRTVPLILLRHASAGSKSDWSGGDDSRPLDAEGEQDARALASLLRCFGVSRVVSAPAERCLATVRPYAAAVGGRVDVEPAFDVVDRDRAGGSPVPGSGREKVAAALAAAAEPVIICAHRENLPVLLAAACGVLGAEPPAEEPLRKGEFLVLHRAAGRLAALERYHPAGDG